MQNNQSIAINTWQAYIPPSSLATSFIADGADYVFNSSQLAINETSIRECVTFTVINDAVSEGGETLQAYLSLAYVTNNGTISNDSIVMFTVDQVNITIFDSIGEAIMLERGEKEREREREREAPINY